MLIALTLIESGIPGVLEAYKITRIEVSKRSLELARLKINNL